MAPAVWDESQGKYVGGAAIASLIDNSGGVAVDGTIAAVTTSATAADAVKELATKVNAILVLLREIGAIDN